MPLVSVALEVSLNAQQYSTDGRAFKFYAHPAVDGLSPDRGPIGGATHVHVSGANFDGGSWGQYGCRFGEIKMVAAFVNQSMITCESPSAAGAGAGALLEGSHCVEVINGQTPTTACTSELRVPPPSERSAPPPGPSLAARASTSTGFGSRAARPSLPLRPPVFSLCIQMVRRHTRAPSRVLRRAAGRAGDAQRPGRRHHNRMRVASQRLRPLSTHSQSRPTGSSTRIRSRPRLTPILSSPRSLRTPDRATARRSSRLLAPTLPVAPTTYRLWWHACACARGRLRRRNQLHGSRAGSGRRLRHCRASADAQRPAVRGWRGRLPILWCRRAARHLNQPLIRPVPRQHDCHRHQCGLVRPERRLRLPVPLRRGRYGRGRLL